MSLQAIIIFLGIVFSAAVIGLIVLKQEKSRLSKILPYFISIASGMILVIALVEFLPLVFSFAESSHSIIFRSVLMILGILFVMLSEKFIAPRLTPTQDCHHHHHKPGEEVLISYQAACSSVGCLIVCAFSMV